MANEEIFRAFKDANPQASDEEVSGAVLQYLDQKGKEGTPQTKGVVDKVYGYAQQGLDAVRSGAEWLENKTSFGDPSKMQAGRIIPPLHSMVPANPTSALVQGAAGLAPGGQGAASTMLRVGTPIAVGGVSGAMDPKSTAAQGALEGAIPGAVEGGLRGAGAVKSVAQRIGTSGRSRVNADKVADDLVSGIAMDMEKASGGTINMAAAFKGEGNSAAKLAEFPARVGKALRAGFDMVERNIAGTAGEMNLPLLAQSDPTRAGKIIQEYVRMAQAKGEDPQALQALVNLVQSNPQAVIAQALKSNPELANYTPKEAMKALKDAAFAAREANPSTPGYATRQVDRGVHEEFTGELAKQGHGNLATEFDKVSRGYWLGKKMESWIEGLGQAGFFKNPEVKGSHSTAPAVNPQGGRDYTTKNQATYGRPDMPAAQSAMFQGQPTGSSNMMRDLAGGLFPSFTRFPGVGGVGSVGVQIPRFRLQENVGQKYPRTPGPQSVESARKTAISILPLIAPSVGVE